MKLHHLAPFAPLRTGLRRLAAAFREPDGSLERHDLPRLNRIFADCGIRPLVAPPTLADDPARIVLGTLLGSRRGRRRFPNALSAGADGPFVKWLIGGLPPTDGERIRTLFASHFGERCKRVYDYRPDLRELFPLGLTPQHRGHLLRWLLTHGAAELGLSAEEVLWGLVELDERPDRGIVPSFLVNARWQAAVPHGLTVFGWPTLLAHLAAEHGARGRWFRELRLPPVYRPWDELTLFRRACPDQTRDFPAHDPAAVGAWLDRRTDLPRPPAEWRTRLAADLAAGLPTTPGVNLLAHFRHPSGLRQAARDCDAALSLAGVRTARRDLPPLLFPGDLAERGPCHSQEVHPTSVAVLAVNSFLVDYLPAAGLHPAPGVRRVGYLYWELDDFPAAWAAHLRAFDELWAPTTFVADALRRRVPDRPVVPMLPGVELSPFEPRPRSFFGLPDGRFLVLFAFDMGSVMARKNPLAVVAAFREAFRPNDRVHLAIKVSNGSSRPAELAKLADAVRGVNGTLLDAHLPRADALALLASCDCYASLHRAEGLGLGMAEAMLFGKPTLGTRYSGNLDFMTDDTAYLVDHTLAAVGPDAGQYRVGRRWADPDVAHAAALLRAIHDRPDDARERGRRAQIDLRERLAPAAAGARMAARLRHLDRTREAHP